MGRCKVAYYQVFCDYPLHASIGVSRELAKGDEYHYLGDNKVVCANCWDNKMTVEALLELLKVEHALTSVGKEYFDTGG